VVVTVRGERFFTPPWGLCGGLAGASAGAWIERGDGKREEIRSKRVFTLHPGERIHFLTPGGGGYGDPLERPADRVREDVLDGKIRSETARGAYGVVLHGDGWSVAEEPTRAERQRRRALRGAECAMFDHGVHGPSGDGSLPSWDVEP
jgi:N-methylhydantoinase B